MLKKKLFVGNRLSNGYYFIIAVVFTFIFSDQAIIKELYGLFGFAAEQKFLDLHSFMRQLDEFRNGGNPYHKINFDSQIPLYNYPPFFKFFLYIPGFSVENLNLIGITLIFFSLLLSLLILQPKSVKHYFFWAIVILSPSFALAFERANTDLIIFILVSTAVLFYRNIILSNLLLLTSGFLKIYSVVGIANLLIVKNSAKKTLIFITGSVLFLLYLLVIKEELSLIIRNTPYAIYDFAFGFKVIPEIILDKFIESKFWVYFTYISICVSLFLLVFLIIKKYSVTTYQTNSLSFYSFVIGSAVITFTYFIGISWDYRKIFIFFTLPFLIENARNRIIKFILLLGIVLCWEQLFVRIVFPHGKRYIYIVLNNVLFLIFNFSVISIVLMNIACIKKMLTNLENRIAEYKRFRKDQQKFANDNVRYYNFWDLADSDTAWFTKFITHRNINPNGKKVTFLSVVGNPKLSSFIKSPKIFFTGENIDNKEHPSSIFSKYHLTNHDLSLGFCYLKDEKYLRFPLWILYMIPPDASFEDIKSLIDSYNDPKHRLNKNRQNFCSNISRADNNGIRKKIIDLIEPIETVKCAGSFLKNTNDLQEKFGDDKIAYLQTFKFNICPENSNTNGYVTEKLFEAVISGSIPIYWGSNGKPDPKIINLDAVLFFDPENPQQLFDKVSTLQNDEERYEEFCQIKPFTENAAEIIWEWLNSLESKIKKII